MEPKDLQIGQKLFVKTRHGIEVWKRIKASEAKNADGTNAGYQSGTVDGDRVLLEKKFIPFNKFLPIRFTNYW
jgi:hypothetical protein